MKNVWKTLFIFCIDIINERKFPKILKKIFAKIWLKRITSTSYPYMIIFPGQFYMFECCYTFVNGAFRKLSTESKNPHRITLPLPKLLFEMTPFTLHSCILKSKVYKFFSGVLFSILLLGQFLQSVMVISDDHQFIQHWGSTLFTNRKKLYSWKLLIMEDECI